MRAAIALFLLAAPGMALGAAAAWWLAAPVFAAAALVVALGFVSLLVGLAIVIGGSNRRW